MCALPALAQAADLVVGVVHDTDGYAVAGAAISLRGSGGAPAGAGTTDRDGTFAIEAGPAVATVDVRCAYCAPMTVQRGPADTPVVAVVRRYAALRDRGISAGDARVLPYASVTDMAALIPFAVATHGTISDRGLAAARGTVIADGIALYRATDGVDLSTAIPAHATTTIALTDPTHANAYDANSAGGLFSIDTLDGSAGLARIDASSGLDATIRAGSALRGAAETSGGTEPASRAVLDATLPTAGGTLDLRALAAAGMGANANAFSSSFALPIRTLSLNAALSTTRSADGNGPENDNVAAVSLQHGGVTFGLRAQRSSGIVDIGTGVQYDSRAYIEAERDAGGTHIFASLAAAQAGDALRYNVSAGGALLPILSIATRIGPSFTVHADSVDALLAAPLYLLYSLPNGTGLQRSHLIDAGLGFDDANRLRIDAMAFRQTIGGATFGTIGGSGISTVWQIAPSVSLRAWTLLSRQNGDTDGAYPGSVYPTGTSTLDRNVTWVTAGSVLRVDTIWRGGSLEGDVSLPAGPHVRFVAGTRRDGPSRVYTAGLIWP